MKKINIEESRFQLRRGVELGRVAMGVFAFAIMAALLNASALERSAELMEYGKARDVRLVFIKPVVYLSEFMRLNLLRGLVERVSPEEGE